MKQRFLLSLLLLFILLSFPSTISGAFAEATTTNAKSAIDSAQSELVICYEAVASADAAGANTTSLILVLNQASWNLSQANLAFKMGDNSSAQSYAEQSLNVSVQNGVVAQANTLRDYAVQERYWNSLITVVCSLVGAADVVFWGLVTWTILRRRYAKGRDIAE